MSTHNLAGALLPKVRAGVLGVLALAAEGELHVREVARRGGLDAPAVAGSPTRIVITP